MRMMTAWFLLFFVTALSMITGCNPEMPESNQLEVLKIGVIYPFSGHSASSGEDLKAGIELALEIINNSIDLPFPMAKQKGVTAHGGLRVEVVYKDSQSDEGRAVRLVEELVVENGVIAVLGCYNSAVTAAAAEQAEVLKIPFMNPDSTSPILIQRGLKWFFRTTPDDAMFAKNFFSFFTDLQSDLNIDISKRLILLYENRLWGTSVSAAERKYALKYGYEIVEDIPYDADSKRLDEELERIRQAMPGIILQSSYADDAVSFMKGYKAEGINPTAIVAMDAGFISPSYLEELGGDGEYIFSREVFALDIGRKRPLVTAVNDLYFKRFGRNMTGNSARSFTGMIVLVDAINRAESLRPEVIRRAILETRMPGNQLIMPWDGVEFDPETGQNVLGKGIIVQIQDGEYRTVWPAELSENKVIWPMPTWSERGGDGKIK